MKNSLLNFLLLATFLHIGNAAETAPAESFDMAALPFFKKYCIRCHGPKKQKSDFRIDTLSREFSRGIGAELWVEVITRMNGGEMPPKKEPQPTAIEVGRIVDWLSERIKEGEAARMAKRGRVAHYRLSREEYSNTVYDLLGVHYDATDPGALTEDPEWHGFNRIGSLLSLSPSHVEKYLKAAETILDEAYPEHKVEPLKVRKDAIDLDWTIGHKRKRIEAAGIADKVRAILWPEYPINYAKAGPGRGKLKHPGVYRVRVKLSGLKPKDARPRI